MNRLLQYLTMAAVAVGLTAAVHAVPTLTINDGANPVVTVTDGSVVVGAVDANPAVGAVTWVGSVGVWTINVDTGVTMPAIGGPWNPALDLHFLDVSSVPATLTLTFSEGGFMQPGVAAAWIGGTTQGTVLYQTFWTGGGPLTTLGAYGPALPPGTPFDYSGSQAGGTVGPGPYSLTQVITITHTAVGNLTTSGDAFLRVPDNGTSIALLGAGITLLALFSRVRRHFV
jgi:hypothetical protein